MEGEEPDGQVLEAFNSGGYLVGDIVEFEVEEDLVTEVCKGLNNVWSVLSEELEADFDPFEFWADVFEDMEPFI